MTQVIRWLGATLLVGAVACGDMTRRPDPNGEAPSDPGMDQREPTRAGLDARVEALSAAIEARTDDPERQANWSRVLDDIERDLEGAQPGVSLLGVEARIAALEQQVGAREDVDDDGGAR